MAGHLAARRSSASARQSPIRWCTAATNDASRRRGPANTPPGTARSEPRQPSHSDISSIRSATMIRPAASMSARWEKACGKFPRCRAEITSNSSAYRPNGRGHLQQPFQHVLGLAHLSDDGQRGHQPERADQEGALLSGQPVVGFVGPVAQDEVVLRQASRRWPSRWRAGAGRCPAGIRRWRPAGSRRPASRSRSAGAVRRRRSARSPGCRP